MKAVKTKFMKLQIVKFMKLQTGKLQIVKLQIVKFVKATVIDKLVADFYYYELCSIQFLLCFCWLFALAHEQTTDMRFSSMFVSNIYGVNLKTNFVNYAAHMLENPLARVQNDVVYKSCC